MELEYTNTTPGQTKMPARHPLNPYPPLQSMGAVRRMTIMIPHSDAVLIETVCPSAGIVTALTLTTIKCLCNELRRTNITTYSPDTVISFVRRLTSIRIAGEGCELDDTSRATSVRGKPAKPKKRPASTRKVKRENTREDNASNEV